MIRTGGGLPDDETRAEPAEQLEFRSSNDFEAGVDVAGDRRDVVGDDRDDAADARDVAGDRRDVVGGDRDDAADARDVAGDRRDVVGGDRDDAADARDVAADEGDKAWFDAGHERTSAGGAVAAETRRVGAASRAASMRDRQAGAAERLWSARDRDTSSSDRRAGETERLYSEHDRAASLADRGAGAGERSSSEHDRAASLADRSAGAGERQEASLDALTGAYVRGSGLVELEREIARARRTHQSLTVAFVDVDQLKIVNDSQGHAAGDQLLIHVVRTIRAKMRAYDLLIRYGGDEFVCVFIGLGLTAVATRFVLVHSELSGDVHASSVTVGLAELQPGDSVETLVSRADEMMYRQREQRRTTPPR